MLFPILIHRFFWDFWSIYPQKMKFLMIKVRKKKFINFNFQQYKQVHVAIQNLKLCQKIENNL